jgi:hypothetical protein
LENFSVVGFSFTGSKGECAELSDTKVVLLLCGNEDEEEIVLL